MTKVVGVRFRNAGKVYYFDPAKQNMKAGDHVIVETARGVEMGTVILSPREVEDDSVVLPLKSVIRSRRKQTRRLWKRTGKKKKRRLRSVWIKSAGISWK